MSKFLNIDFGKNTKFTYYMKNISRLFIPDSYYQKQLDYLLSCGNDNEYIQTRLNYYNKLNTNFSLPESSKTIQEFKLSRIKKESVYYFDLLEYLRYFNKNSKILYQFGDITTVPEFPSFIKSRPIEGDNSNSILMNLNKIRHFIYVNDSIQFKNKQNILFWRGKIFQSHRKYFMSKFYNHPLCNVGQTNTKKCENLVWIKEKVTISDHFKYKFILTIEGNDVASNLKWVMSSNSLSFMVKPKFETWFMEGTLIPNFHYVLLKDDYSDLEEKIEYYSQNIREAEFIIHNANEYVNQFKNKELERIIALNVIDKYIRLSGNLR